MEDVMMFAGAIRAREIPADHVSPFRDAPVSALEGIVGCSDELRRVLNHAGRVAATDATVLITGESGTGKDLIAQAIHENSGRAGRPFIKVNCAAITPSLTASE